MLITNPKTKYCYNCGQKMQPVPYGKRINGVVQATYDPQTGKQMFINECVNEKCALVNQCSKWGKEHKFNLFGKCKCGNIMHSLT